MCLVCVSDSGQLEKQLEDVTSARRDLEDSSKYIKTLEKQMKAISQERDDMHKVDAEFHLCVCVCVTLCGMAFCPYSFGAVPSRNPLPEKCAILTAAIIYSREMHI